MTKSECQCLGLVDKAATLGPWRVEKGFQGAEHRLFLVRSPQSDGVAFGRTMQDDSDVVFVAHARTALSAALDMLERAAKVLEPLLGFDPQCTEEHCERPECAARRWLAEWNA